jgi:hypothetical protein
MAQLRPSGWITNAPAAAGLAAGASPQRHLWPTIAPWLRRSVRTWKNHFIASWATADVACPPPLWATTVEHCELTLNLCRPSYRNQSISAWELHKRYPFHSRPLGPVGCKVQVFLPAAGRPSWSAHSEEGFYVRLRSPLPQQHRVWVTSTRAERTVQTLVGRPSRGT